MNANLCHEPRTPQGREGVPCAEIRAAWRQSRQVGRKSLQSLKLNDFCRWYKLNLKRRQGQPIRLALLKQYSYSQANAKLREKFLCRVIHLETDSYSRAPAPGRKGETGVGGWTGQKRSTEQVCKLPACRETRSTGFSALVEAPTKIWGGETYQTFKTISISTYGYLVLRQQFHFTCKIFKNEWTHLLFPLYTVA